jgi:hypothetical protein
VALKRGPLSAVAWSAVLVHLYSGRTFENKVYLVIICRQINHCMRRRDMARCRRNIGRETLVEALV